MTDNAEHDRCHLLHVLLSDGSVDVYNVAGLVKSVVESRGLPLESRELEFKLFRRRNAVRVHEWRP